MLLFANEMNKLSFQERETIYDEIHGIDVRNAEIRNESPELLLKSLELLDAELQKLRPKYAAWDASRASCNSLPDAINERVASPSSFIR